MLPAQIATCAADGTPNVTYLSHVQRIDERHVALSCQFFNKTKQNVLANPYASVILYDPVTFEAWQLKLRYQRAETEGPLFDAMSLRIQAIASHTGMSGVFRLLSADVYEVLACDKHEGFVDVPAEVELDDPGGPRSELRGLHVLTQRAARAPDLETLLSDVLAGLEETMGFEHAMFLVPDETGERLFTVASRGYGDAGIGAEVAIGEGLIGMVAKERRLLRLSGVENEMRYGRAIRSSIEQAGGRPGLHPEVPLAGLPDAQASMALPLIVGDHLVGVLAVESRDRLGIDEWDETFLEIVASQVAFGFDNVILRERAHDVGRAPAPAPAREAREAPPRARAPSRRFRLFKHDDCVFVDDDYLIRNVPGRILWKLLRTHVDTGRTEFSNRELRLDPALGLPALRDNLESRLVLLRKRLAFKCPELALPSTTRGHFRLEAQCEISLEETC